MEMNFCRRCGTRLTSTEGNVFKCEQGHTIYANASPCVGVFFLTQDNEVLLSARGIEPQAGALDSFGGFLLDYESFEAGAIRELREELSIEPEDYEKLTYLTSGPAHYTYENDTQTVVSVFFWTRLTGTRQPVPGDDVVAIKSIPLHDVDLSLLRDEDSREGIRALQALFPDTHNTPKGGENA